MNLDPSGKPYYHSEEQVEAAKYEKEGKMWGPALCRSCKHTWIAVCFPKDKDDLECPECSEQKGFLDILIGGSSHE